MAKVHQPIDKKKLILNIVIVLVILALALTLVFSIGDFRQISYEISHLNWAIYVFALLFSLFAILVNSFGATMIIRTMGKEMRFIDSMTMFSTEPFFNGITPMNSGSQPFYIYQMYRHKMSLDKASGVAAVNFMVYQATITTVMMVLTLVFIRNLTEALQWRIVFIFLGILINIVLFLIMFLMATSKRFKGFVKGLLGFFAKIKWLKKHCEKAILHTDEFVNNFQYGVKHIIKFKRVYVVSVICDLVHFCLKFGAIVFVIVAMGYYVAPSNYIYITAIGALAILGMMWVPIPGGIGAAEFVLTLMIAPLLGPLPRDVTETNAIIAIIVMWRLATYYFQMLMGIIFLTIFNFTNKIIEINPKLESITPKLEGGDKHVETT